MQKRETRVHGSATKKFKHTVIQKYYFLEILINVKAGRVKWGARKVYHGRRVGQACLTVFELAPIMSATFITGCYRMKSS
jgi:hypothetical protein